MKILFIHQNFPGQFKHLARQLSHEGHQVKAFVLRKGESMLWNGVEVIPYLPSRSSTPNIHPWLIDFETKTIRAEACYRASIALKKKGFSPDVIVAHPGWGESLFLKEVWPRAKLGIYCEFYYKTQDADVGFDPEFRTADEAEVCRIQFKNLNNQQHFQVADAGLSPTHWQASTFPEPFRSRITVVHDGIDTQQLKPNPNIRMQLHKDPVLALTKADEVITFVNRNLEPYRGYHIFMRALPTILKRRPTAHVLLVGGNDVSYGARPISGTWKDQFINEVRPTISDNDWARVHFLGNLGYAEFIAMMQLSTVHVYLTYPFVLSWSLLESMSLGCAIVASDTPPLKEAIFHNDTGRLVNFFDPAGLTDQVVDLCEDAKAREKLGQAARAFAIANYDLGTACLPRQLHWVQALADQRSG
jgi:glycosyltransferase involved in cell wall biosynthesis